MQALKWGTKLEDKIILPEAGNHPSDTSASSPPESMSPGFE
jgi:hypothetical protein